MSIFVTKFNFPKHNYNEKPFLHSFDDAWYDNSICPKKGRSGM
jgi:hypothetical protein